ncbi:hypothetical protein MPSEU_000444400 [Mayamaea pseudoterrestris]|nr:hypothetical protein MPSEU_000444400 [Mayamaea pseudoterrestris]
MSIAAPKPQQMSRGTEAMRTHLSGATNMEVRETRRGWLMECLCPCNAKNEIKYYINGQQMATSLEESNCLCRWCCGAVYPFTTRIEEVPTKTELLTVERPFVCCVVGACKCCCYQQASFKSGSDDLGKIQENCYYCVPQYTLLDANGNKVYKIHPPTCCAGCCVNCCTEGNPCFGKGCCKLPFWIFDPNQRDTNGGDAAHLGKILKKPKSLAMEVFTDANAFEIVFPKEATPEQKASLVGTSIFFNAVYFERSNEG